jgi:hypothetical protein
MLDSPIKGVEDYFSVSLAGRRCQDVASSGPLLIYCLPQARAER